MINIKDTHLADAIILSRTADSIFYMGKEEDLKKTVNPVTAGIFYRNNKDHIKEYLWTELFLGKSIKKKVPVSTDEANTAEFTQINPEFERYISSMSRARRINDEMYQFLIHFSQHFNIFWDEQNTHIHIFKKNDEEISKEKFGFSFKPKSSPKAPDEKGSAPEQEEYHEVITGSIQDYHTLTEEDKKYRNCLLTIKEVSDGYVDLRQHSVIVTDESGSRQALTYKMAEDITIVLNHETQEVISIEQEPCKYHTRKTGTSWMIVHDTELNPDHSKVEEDFKTFKTIMVESDPENSKIKTYRLKGVYTHILRRVLNFDPQSWQMQFLMNQMKESYLAGCRRMGKSALAAYLTTRELFAMPQKQTFRNRPRKGVLLAPTKDKYKEVLDYITEYTGKIRELRNFTYNVKLDRLVFEDQFLTAGTKSVTPLSICDFGTARGFEAGRGRAADWVCFEEAGYIPVEAFDNIMPIIEGEGAIFVAISTINPSDSAQWFLRELQRAEDIMRSGKPDIDIYALRVTVDDIDERVMSQKQKDAMKERALVRGYTYYYAELYATVPSKNTVFDINGFFTQSFPLGQQPSDNIIIAYDPAKRSDYAGVVIAGVNSADSKMTIFEEHRWQGLSYHEQREKFQNIMSRFPKAITVMDATGVGEAVREIFRGLIQFAVIYTTRKQPAILDQFGTWNIGKRDLVEITQSLIEKGLLKASPDMEVLASEMTHFTEFKTRSNNYSYQAKTGHDDVVNAMLLVGFVYGKIQGNFREYDATLAINPNKPLPRKPNQHGPGKSVLRYHYT